MALALKKYTLVPTAEGTLDPLFPDGNTAPSAPALGSVIVISPTQLNVQLAIVSTGGVPPLTYALERSETSASAGFSVTLLNAFPSVNPHQDAGLTPATQYWYRCKSVDSNSTPRESEYSNVVTGTTQVASGDVTPPDPVTWVGTGIVGVTSTTITLSWEATEDH